MEAGRRTDLDLYKRKDVLRGVAHCDRDTGAGMNSFLYKGDLQEMLRDLPSKTENKSREERRAVTTKTAASTAPAM